MHDMGRVAQYPYVNMHENDSYYDPNAWLESPQGDNNDVSDYENRGPAGYLDGDVSDAAAGWTGSEADYVDPHSSSNMQDGVDGARGELITHVIPPQNYLQGYQDIEREQHARPGTCRVVG